MIKYNKISINLCVLSMSWLISACSAQEEVSQTNYQWSTWKDSAGGRLAHDSKWFILPSENLIPKPVPYIEKDDNNFLSNLIGSKMIIENVKTYEYWTHLCKSEAIILYDTEYKDSYKEGFGDEQYDIAYLRENDQLIKNFNSIANDKIKVEQLNKTAFMDLNNKFYGYYDKYSQTININKNFNDYNNKKVSFNLNEVTNKYHQLSGDNTFPAKSMFKEFLTHDGQLYRIEFDINSSNYLWGDYLPMKKVDKINARYYKLWREIEREDLKRNHILGSETIIYDTEKKQLVSYKKNFMYASCPMGNHSWCNDPPNWYLTKSCTSIKQVKKEEL